MTRIELQIDDDVLVRARRSAELQNESLEGLVERFIEGVAEPSSVQDPFLGMFADQPEVVDAVVASAFEARERDPLRHNGE